ncbi:uncharacterized protein LOC131841204 [Achroia grisella]|uniref:uncharacterized protein LOC131841204 n=1 Tax=Achroia grisella TaxID=688607 RepID=UPI0027D22581|nr:uncharacterized protein LOC131841204 [Achroia grisella]
MDALQSNFFSMMEELNGKMTAFQNDLQKVNTTPSTVSPYTVATLAADFAVFQSFVTSTFCSFQQQLELIGRQMDHFEMRSRRKILLLHGVRESSGNNTSQDVVKVIGEKLKIPGFSEANISRCHRLGRSFGAKPRPILVKFPDLTLRNSVWFAKTALKDSGITISEFLTKGRHEAFMTARRHFGVKKCWTRDGCVIVAGDDGTKNRVTTITDVNKLINLSASDPVVPQHGSSLTMVAGSSAATKATTAVTARVKRVVRK